MPKLPSLTLGLTVAVALCSVAEARSITPQDIVNSESIGAVRVSSHSDVAFVVHRPCTPRSWDTTMRGQGENTLWLWQGGQAPVKLGVTTNSILFSPSGAYLAAAVPHDHECVVGYWSVKDRVYHPVGRVPTLSWVRLAWTATGRLVTVRGLPPVEANAPHVLDARDRNVPEDEELVSYDPATRQIQVLDRGHFASISIPPSGDEMAWVKWDRFPQFRPEYGKFFTADWKVVVRGPLHLDWNVPSGNNDVDLSWSPSGQRLAVDVDDGVHLLDAQGRRDLPSVHSPVWLGNHVLGRQDGHWIEVGQDDKLPFTPHATKTGIVAVQDDTVVQETPDGAPSKLEVPGAGDVSVQVVGQDVVVTRGTAHFLLANTLQPVSFEGRAVGVRGQQVVSATDTALTCGDHVLWHGNAHWSQLEPVRLQRIAAAGGLSHWLALPPASSPVPAKGYPVVVWIYPGKTYTDQPPTLRFALTRDGLFSGNADFLIQCWAAHGYAVYLPSMPDATLGSADLGQYSNEHEPLQARIRCLRTAMDDLRQSHDVDMSRLVLAGHSGGGAATLQCITADLGFRAAISSCGIGDYAGWYLNLKPVAKDKGMTENMVWNHLYFHWGEVAQGDMVVPPWGDAPRWTRNSAIYLADHIHVPLLLLDGDPDYNNGGEMFTALERLGQPVRMVHYPQDSHPPVTGADNLLDFWHEMYQWVDEYDP